MTNKSHLDGQRPPLEDIPSSEITGKETATSTIQTEELVNTVQRKVGKTANGKVGNKHGPETTGPR